MVILAIFLLFAGLAGCEAHKMDSWQSNSVLGCGVYLSKMQWMYESSSNFYSSICAYEPALGSWSTCIHDMLNDRMPNERDIIYEKTLTNVKDICQLGNKKFAEELTFERYNASRNNASRYLCGDDDTYMNSPLTCPVKVDKAMRDRIGNAYHYYSSNFDNSSKYGSMTYVYFIVVVLISCAFKVCKTSALSRSILKYRFINLVRGYLVLPTLFGKHASHLETNWLCTGLIPTTFESLMILGYTLISATTLAVKYQLDPFNFLFPSKWLQFIRLLADRSGIIAIIQVPLIILFSTRNNIVECLTGFKYTTMIMLHKWIGRVMILEACIHSIAYALYATLLHSYKASADEAYWKFGVIAMTSCVGLLVLSMGIIRKCTYETFLYIHILLVIVFFYTYFKHVESFGFGSTIYFPLSLWVIERILRVVRILRFGYLKARIQLIDDDLLRITIQLPSCQKQKAFEPGQYIFLYFMQPSIFWQSHPFTVIHSNNELTLVVKPKKGATNTMLKKVRQVNGFLEINVLVEGPYGSRSAINKSDRLLFLAGGTGIPGPLSHAIELGKRQSKRTIDLVITVRELDILKAYRSELLLLEHLPVHLVIHLTNSITTTTYSSTEETEIITKLKSFATIRNGRPDVEKLINESLNNGPLAIVCCGPASFVDQTRDFVAKVTVENPSAPVEYLEEYQCW
ncbi:hypothetical protein HG535_0B05780 [Zygotorulaspora mrakii]|uniref:ferric-chelate reductase (NADPH) n=1 Tax=Zygotorulaspora mrakii TaxID=42260 RepID=A0A7H9AYP7_ZYGMR|nr:uncharacterized protein HG535_0B05780 [Zygotorulaspora mrakii]QLG71535.1 hypothetical protein HG535_0B05780 [Zygotorulaspora mrakii]